jgi:hypothetical protein
MTVEPTEGKEEEEMNYQMHFDPYLIEHLNHRQEELLQVVETLRLQEQLRKNRKARGSSRLAALVKRGRLLVELAQ